MTGPSQIDVRPLVALPEPQLRRRSPRAWTWKISTPDGIIVRRLPSSGSRKTSLIGTVTPGVPLAMAWAAASRVPPAVVCACPSTAARCNGLGASSALPIRERVAQPLEQDRRRVRTSLCLAALEEELYRRRWRRPRSCTKQCAVFLSKDGPQAAARSPPARGGTFSHAFYGRFPFIEDEDFITSASFIISMVALGLVDGGATSAGRGLSRGRFGAGRRGESSSLWSVSRSRDHHHRRTWRREVFEARGPG